MRSVFSLIVLAGLSGCTGDRWVSIADEATTEGRWRPDGVLIRSYNVTLEQAAGAIRSIAESNRWLILSDAVGDRDASISVKTRELVPIDFYVWAPADRATEIGIRYDGRNRAGAIRIFQDVERKLPNKRITVNQPQ